MENRYDKYKDSGIAWIGEIPEHWEKICLKRLSNINTGNQDTQDSVPDGKYPFFVRSPKVERSNKYTFEGASILMAGDGVGAGKVFHLADDKFACHQRVYCINQFKNINRIYLFYYLSSLFYHVIESANSKSTVDSVRLPMLAEFTVFMPLDFEQQSIATYLDQKCGEIDELITLQEEMITKLQSYKQSIITEAVTKGLDKNVPLKDSGIEWIGEIPKHWKVKRLKFSCNVFGRIGFRGYKSDDLVSEGNGAITLSPSNMKDMKMDYTNRTYLSWKKYYESPEIMISKNDILMVKTGSTYGKCSFVDDIPMECTINPQIVVFKQHKDYPKFLAYSFQTKATRAFVETSVVGGTIPTIAQEKIMNYFFAFPPLSEQQSITDYLDQKCSEIDELISIKQQKIEKLKDYKKSLIFECVTGKRKVS